MAVLAFWSGQTRAGRVPARGYEGMSVPTSARRRTGAAWASQAAMVRPSRSSSGTPGWRRPGTRCAACMTWGPPG